MPPDRTIPSNEEPLYPPMFKHSLMLTKALFIPFRFEQNLNYFNKIKQILI
ncbi:hypothetical protein MAN88_02480 [Microcystis aeruginosa]|nr:hypothetical protein MAN88_02480 [Microcystis aeruginosa]